MSRHHCLPILPASELRHVFLGCDHFAVCMTTSCYEFDSLVAIVLVVFLLSYLAILCRDLMVMSRPLFLPYLFSLGCNLSPTLQLTSFFPTIFQVATSRWCSTSLSSAQLFFRSRPQ